MRPLYLLIFHLFTLTASSAAPDSELLSRFAAMNQNELQRIQGNNPELHLYSLVPLTETSDYSKTFVARFFTIEGRQLTHNINYIKINNIWQLQTKKLYDPDFIRKSNSSP